MPFDNASGSTPTAETIRSAARWFLRTDRERLICAACRLAGDDGAAIACAFSSDALKPDTSPIGWPLRQILAILEQGRSGTDRHVPKLISRLEVLSVDVDRLAAKQANQAPD